VELELDFQELGVVLELEELVLLLLALQEEPLQQQFSLQQLWPPLEQQEQRRLHRLHQLQLSRQ
jgi:hypothetical protein